MNKISKGLAVCKATVEAVCFGMQAVPLRFWDVGARGGLSRSMAILYRFGVVRPVFFEPDASEAQHIMSAYRNCDVINYALSRTDGEAILHLTREPGYSSLLRPLAPVEVVKTELVATRRADTLLRNMDVDRHPEMLKLDVQGAELAALEGFGDFLNRVTCIETEVSFRNTYEDQPLISAIVQFLMERNFGLVDLRVFGVRSSKAAVQGNAFFIRRDLRTKRDVAVERVFRSLNGISLVV